MCQNSKLYKATPRSYLFNVMLIVHYNNSITVIIFIVLIGLRHTSIDEIYCEVTEQRLVGYICTDKLFYTYT